MSQKYAHLRTIVWLVLMGIAICGIPTQKTDATAIAAQKISAATNPAPNVIPRLREWQGGTGTFHLSNASQIAVDRSYAAQLDETAAVFRNDVQSVTGRRLSIIHTRSPAPGDFFLTLNTSDAGIGQEGYLFQVSDDVVIRANSNRGILYGTRTALQILLQDRSKSHLPQGKARDYPKYQERGFMLDVGRKFVPLRFLEDSLKLMAWYKLNDFHLHLNDNPAFRLKSTNSAFSGLAAADGSYTKQEMRQLQDLAKQYAITITPEIDTPAHDRAITKFRPDLTLSSNKNFLDLQNSKTIPFMKSLWDKFTPWFDTNQFHIGADEYDSKYADLYRQYVNTFDDYLGKKGKTVRMWGSLTKIGGSVAVHTNIIIDVWNNQWQNPVNAVHQGYHVINDSDRLLYIVPKAGYYNDYLDTKTIYEKWEPTIFDLNNSKLNISYGDSHLLGGQFAEWNDNYRHVSIADIYDRVSAAMPTMGEKLWSGTTSTRTYEQFQQIAHVLGDGPGTHLPHNPPKLALQLPGTASARQGWRCSQ